MQRRFNTYGGNYSTYVRTKAENETNQMKAYNKQQDEIKHIKECVLLRESPPARTDLFLSSFIASAGTYANLVKQAKSKQKVRSCFSWFDVVRRADVALPRSSTRWRLPASSRRSARPSPFTSISRTFASSPLRLSPSTTSLSPTLARWRTPSTRISPLVSSASRFRRALLRAC